VISFLPCLPAGVFASTEVGTISDGYGYAWGNNSGWFNFDTEQGAVVVRDASLSGYFWSENFGWVNLSPPGSGVSNNDEGTLAGYAWGENTGWINFSGVIINSSGQFTGTASGDITGTVSFDCGSCVVKTDWRPKSSRSGSVVEVIGGGSALDAFDNPIPPFNILINDGQEYTKNPTVNLKFNAGSNVKLMVISESPSFENAIQENYQTTKTFVLSPADGKKVIYVKFYTQYGRYSETASDSIILKTQPPEIKITYIKEKYSPEEEVILSGKTESGAEVSFYLDQQYTSFKADSNGEWLISLGKLSLGEHKIELVPKDAAGNSGEQLSEEFSVEAGVPVSQPDFSQLPPESKIVAPEFSELVKEPQNNELAEEPKKNTTAWTGIIDWKIICLGIAIFLSVIFILIILKFFGV